MNAAADCEVDRLSGDPASLMADNVRIYLQVKHAYEQCAPEIQEIVGEMVAICGDPESEPDQKQRAVRTIVEALFPGLTADAMGRHRRFRRAEQNAERESDLDNQEATFAERLGVTIKAKGWTQADLAKSIGVGQPAISNMLNRQSRPQRKTVRNIAAALGVEPQELWPGFQD